MNLFLRSTAETRAKNARALAALGVPADSDAGSSRVVRNGMKVRLYTVGYEKRDGEELMSLLVSEGVKVLADIRERPMSRKPDFREKALRKLCEESGVEYQLWSALGSTEQQREELQASGDFKMFAKAFKAHAKKTMKAEMIRLAEGLKKKPTALLCYERNHFECHRSVIAELVADQVDATVIAL